MPDNAEELKERAENNAERLPLIKLLSSPKVIFGCILVYAGIGIPWLLKSGPDLNYILNNQAPMAVGVVVAFLGFWVMISEISKLKPRREERFVDVDDNRDNEKSDFQLRILKDLKSLKNQTNSLTPEKLQELLSMVAEKKLIESSAMYESFESYFNDIRAILVEQAHTADKKASILLDKGTSYSRWGIAFFIVAIVVWQVLSWVTGFKVQYIYGIVSCSLLFIFIEILSAWFLKQYRHFVDTSTYHIKVKSIFDKYMMSFLAIKTLGSDGDNQEFKYQAMLKILEGDIKWPESYLLKDRDASLATDALETMAHFAKVIKSEAKNQSNSG